jgi:hypothetical protein
LPWGLAPLSIVKFLSKILGLWETPRYGHDTPGGAWVRHRRCRGKRSLFKGGRIARAVRRTALQKSVLVEVFWRFGPMRGVDLSLFPCRGAPVGAGTAPTKSPTSRIKFCSQSGIWKRAQAGPTARVTMSAWSFLYLTVPLQNRLHATPGVADHVTSSRRLRSERIDSVLVRAFRGQECRCLVGSGSC